MSLPCAGYAIRAVQHVGAHTVYRCSLGPNSRWLARACYASEAMFALTTHRDGSIMGRDGKVLHFGAQRFYDDVVVGNCCFVCGRKASKGGAVQR